MSVQRLSGWFAAAVMASAVVSAQVPTQQQPPQTGDQKSAAPASITIAGCVAKETDVLKKSATGTMTANAGMSDEFVLTQSVVNPAAKTSETPAARPDEPTGTSGGANKWGRVYRVTGDKENELKSYVGQRVEITGSFKRDADAQREMSPTGTSGSTAEPSVDNTPEFTIMSVKPATSGSCAAR